MKEFRRIRDWMEIPGRYYPGERNAITDVPGVTVGHKTMIKEDYLRTGVTIIKQHEGNPFLKKVPCAVYAGNGYGKLAGSMQVDELGEMETILGLTNTLSVSPVLQGIINYHIKDMSLMRRSINPLVGETNDAYFNDVIGCHITPEDVKDAIDNLSKDVEEGAVGAGTGTYCYGFKGGIGTSSRVVKGVNIGQKQDFTVGALVQTNFGGTLNIYGNRVPYKDLPTKEIKGSCMIVVATDAPMDSRQLRRIAKRGILGMTNTGSYMNHHSGDFCVAFSNYEKNLIDTDYAHIRQVDVISETQITNFFEATVEAVQEAVYNSLTMSPDMTGYEGRSAKGFDITKYDYMIDLKK